MNKLFASALIAAAGFAAAPSFAGQYLGGEVGYSAPDTQAAASTLTRAEVQAEAARAVQQGRIIGGRVLQAPAAAVTTQAGPATRAEVRAEAAYAVRHGLIAGGEV